jgi:hypothetical protein
VAEGQAMIEFEYTLDINGRELPVMVEAEGRVYGHNYGEDADGRRGEWRTECEDVVLKITDGHGKDITKKVETKYKAQFESIDELAADKLIDAYNEGPDYEHDED